MSFKTFSYNMHGVFKKCWNGYLNKNHFWAPNVTKIHPGHTALSNNVNNASYFCDKKKLQMLSFEGGGMGFRRTILLTRLSFWTTSTRNGRRKKGWRIGRIASRSRLNTREVACWLGQRESSSRPTTLLNRHRLIFSSKFDWFFASNPLILHCQSFIFFILLVAISIIRCSLRSTSNQSWGGSKLSHQQSLDLPLPGQQVEKGGKD